MDGSIHELRVRYSKITQAADSLMARFRAVRRAECEVTRKSSAGKFAGSGAHRGISKVLKATTPAPMLGKAQE